MIAQSLKSILFLTLLLVFLPAQLSAAGIPAQFSIQGVVSDAASGRASAGFLPVQFTLYDES